MPLSPSPLSFFLGFCPFDYCSFHSFWYLPCGSINLINWLIRSLMICASMFAVPFAWNRLNDCHTIVVFVDLYQAVLTELFFLFRSLSSSQCGGLDLVSSSFWLLALRFPPILNFFAIAFAIAVVLNIMCVFCNEHSSDYFNLAKLDWH